MWPRTIICCTTYAPLLPRIKLDSVRWPWYSPSSRVRKELGLGFAQQQRRGRDPGERIVQSCHVGRFNVNAHRPTKPEHYARCNRCPPVGWTSNVSQGWSRFPPKCNVPPSPAPRKNMLDAASLTALLTPSPSPLCAGTCGDAAGEDAGVSLSLPLLPGVTTAVGHP